MRCVAIIMVHNGLQYLQYCIDHLQQQSIEIALVDHGSTDGTYEYCLDCLRQELCYFQRISYNGYFSLEQQLSIKAHILEQLETDWVIHQDIDECLESPSDSSLILSEFLELIDKLGFNVLNFNEFVFIPYLDSPNQTFYDSLYYYFFQPSTPRLMRAWKKSADLSNISTGGHLLHGDLKLYPVSGILKHYAFTDQEHAYQKYSNRSFAKFELDKGWHSNRVNIPRDKMLFPEVSKLEKLTSKSDKHLSTIRPWRKHYWQVE